MAIFYAQHDVPTLQAVELEPHERWITETRALLEAFLDTVLEGKPLQCSGRDHLLSLAMVEACIQSAKTQKTIHVEDVLPT